MVRRRRPQPALLHDPRAPSPTSTISCVRSPCSTSSPTTPTARAGTACSPATTCGAIDHGLCFAAPFKLRTVIWEFGGEIDRRLRAGARSRRSRTSVPLELADVARRRRGGGGAAPGDEARDGAPVPRRHARPSLPLAPRLEPGSGLTRETAPTAPKLHENAVERDWSASISFGRTLWTSPTMPRSAMPKIGASLSLLMAMMFFEPFIPTMCWVAPEMPAAM